MFDFLSSKNLKNKTKQVFFTKNEYFTKTLFLTPKINCCNSWTFLPRHLFSLNQDAENIDCKQTVQFFFSYLALKFGDWERVPPATPLRGVFSGLSYLLNLPSLWLVWQYYIALVGKAIEQVITFYGIVYFHIAPKGQCCRVDTRFTLWEWSEYIPLGVLQQNGRRRRRFFMMYSTTNANRYVHTSNIAIEEAFHLSYLNSSNPCNFDGNEELEVASPNKMQFYQSSLGVNVMRLCEGVFDRMKKMLTHQLSLTQLDTRV